MFKPLLIAASLAAMAAPAAAQTNDLSQLDVSRAQSLGEQLVLCDRAKLLSNPPNRNAQRTFVRVDNDRFDLALPPDFTRPSGWYDYGLERAYDRLRSRGLVQREDVYAARERLPRLELSLSRPTVSERRFLQAQTTACGRLIREASSR